MFDFDAQQFSTQQLLACSPGLNHETFRQWLRRGVISMSVELGSGKRPLYRGHDVLQVALRHELTNFGVFAHKFHFIWQVAVRPRVVSRQIGMSDSRISVFFWIDPRSCELMLAQLSETGDANSERLDAESVPDAHLFFRVDRFIDHVVQRMERVKAGLPAVEPITQEEAERWSGDLSVDEDGNKIFVGLSKDESFELLSLMELVSKDRASDMQVSRYHELDNKHVLAKAYRFATKRPNDDEDWNRAWITDERGVRLMVGLSPEETDEFIALNIKTVAHTLKSDFFPWASHEEEDRENSRWMVLQDKHELARLARINADASQLNPLTLQKFKDSS
ncbi:MAG: hypothetical protein U1E25_14465 [Methylocystis sp.]